MVSLQPDDLQGRRHHWQGELLPCGSLAGCGAHFAPSVTGGRCGAPWFHGSNPAHHKVACLAQGGHRVYWHDLQHIIKMLAHQAALPALLSIYVLLVGGIVYGAFSMGPSRPLCRCRLAWRPCAATPDQCGASDCCADVVVKPPSVGMTTNARGLPQYVPLKAGQVHGQYITEGLVAGILVLLGAGGLLALEQVSCRANENPCIIPTSAHTGGRPGRQTWPRGSPSGYCAQCPALRGGERRH